MSELSEREVEIVNSLVRGWVKADAPLPGDLSYGDVLALLERLGADPTPLNRLLEWFSQRQP